MAAALKLADKPAETLPPERQRLADSIVRRDEAMKRVDALEAALASARDDEYDAQADLEKWKEYLPSATEAEVRNRVNTKLGKPLVKLDKTSAEAKQAITNLEDTIATLKRTREVLTKDLERASRDFRSAETDIEVAILKITETAPEVERLYTDLAIATATHMTLVQAVNCFPVPQHLSHLGNPANPYDSQHQGLRKKWEESLKALKNDATAPLPT
jgi:chromosome segregation ATPase